MTAIASLPKPNKPTIIDTVALDVGGMKCAGCVKAVERQINQCDGVVGATVNLITAVALVEYEPEKINPEKVAEKLTMGGFPSAPRPSQSEENWQEKHQKQREKEQKTQTYQLTSALLLLIFSTIGHLHHLTGWHYLHPLSNIWFHWALATGALIMPGRDIILNGWQGIWHRSPNMNSLIGIGTVSAYVTSCIALFYPELGWECFFDEPVMLLGFIFLGRVLESRARRQASQSLESLLSLRPHQARIISKNESLEDQGLLIPSVQVKPQEWVKVLQGEQFPTDGVVVKGQTTVNEGMLTGESLPVYKTMGDSVKAGTINQAEVVIIETTATGADTVISQIIATVEEAQTRKAPIQNLADTVSGYFAYGIITIALLTLTFWYFYGMQKWSYLTTDTSALILSIKLAIDVLVIACPCALGLATPTAILVGTGKGAEQGLLIKGGDILEQVEKINTIVFDKTGTLTNGYPQVTDIIAFYNHTEQEIISLASSLEINSQHPFAQALLRELQKQELCLYKTENLTTTIGKGVKGIVDYNHQKITFTCGNQLWLKEQNINLSSDIINQTETLQNEGKSVIYLSENQEIIALIALADEIRDQAPSTVKALQNMGLEVIMISGDQPKVVQNIAQKLGISKYYGGIQPQGKADLIDKIKEERGGRFIAMVGDGVNDAPALSRADCGIAMAQGSQIALETASIVLTRGKLTDLITAIKLSQNTLKKIKQNLFWALSYNLVTIPLACGVLLPRYHILLNPATAGALMALSSIVVVTNSLQLKKMAT